MATDDRYKTNITIPAYHWKWLKIWAYFKGVSPTALANNTLQARVEANLDQIKGMATERAEDLGISLEELIDRIINDKEDDD